jgi:multisubunit Na+/H+ antiporter MnhB subunit
VIRTDEPHTPAPLPLVGMIDSPILRTAATMLAPAMVVASLWLLVRGHDAVGGGFIGGLTAGSAVVLLFVSRGHERIWQSRWLRSIPLLGIGLAVALLYGFGGLALAGAFLAGQDVTLPFGVHVAASLLFDIGVFLVVVGLMVTILRHLGQDAAEPPADPDRYRPAPAPEPEVGR